MSYRPPTSIAYQPSTNPPYPYDPEQARTILTRAGWADVDGDGVLQKGGTPLTITLLTNNVPKSFPELFGVGYDPAVAQIVADWKAVGARVRVRRMGWEQFANTLFGTHDFQIALMSVSGDADPDESYLWATDAYPEGFNVGRYSSDAVDLGLAEGLRRTTVHRGWRGTRWSTGHWLQMFPRCRSGARRSSWYRTTASSARPRTTGPPSSTRTLRSGTSATASDTWRALSGTCLPERKEGSIARTTDSSQARNDRRPTVQLDSLQVHPEICIAFTPERGRGNPSSAPWNHVTPIRNDTLRRAPQPPENCTQTYAAGVVPYPRGTHRDSPQH